jgi:hypothetical protein
MNVASAAKFSTSLQGQMSPTLKAAIDYASKASVTGLVPTHQGIVDKALANSNLGGLSTPTLTNAIDKYLERSDIVSLGKELARHPAVADLAAGQTFAGSTSAMQKAFEEAGSASTPTGSMPVFSQAMINTGLGSKLAEVTRIAPRHQEFIGFGAASNSALVQIATGNLPYPPMSLSPEVYRLAAESFPSARAFSFIRGHEDLAKIRGVLPGVLGSVPDFSAPMMPAAGAGALGTALLAGQDHHRVADYWKWSGGSALAELDLSSKAITALGRKYGTSPSVLELTAAGLLSPATSRDKGLGAWGAGIEPVTSPSPTPKLQSAPTRRLPARRDHEVAPVAASYFAGQDRWMVIALLDTADLDIELEHLEALEERLRSGNTPARNHAAVSARQLLLGVANHVFPPRPETRRCRLGCPRCPHQLGSTQVNNRIVAFVDQQLIGELDSHEFKVFVAQMDYVHRWGARGTHENLSRTDAVKAFVRLLEVLAMVARAYGIQPSA